MGIECNKQCCENNKNETNLDFNRENKILDNNNNNNIFSNDKLKTSNKMFNIKSNLKKKFKIYNISNNEDNNLNENIIFIIYIQAIYRGYIYRKYFIEIKKNLIKYTEYKIECTKLRYSNKFLNNITKNIFPLHFTYPFNSEDKETQTNSMENVSNNNNYNNNNKNRLFYSKIYLTYKNFQEISYYSGYLNINYVRNGYGILYTISGFIYEGNWLNNKLNGYCRVIDINKKIIKEGKYVDNVLEGYGKVLIDNGDYYEGNFKNGKFDGKGNYIWYNGDVFEGEYKNGLKNGKGVFKWVNGDIYKGEFKNGKILNKGKLIKENERYKNKSDNNDNNIFIHKNIKSINNKKIKNLYGSEEDKVNIN